MSWRSQLQFELGTPVPVTDEMIEAGRKAYWRTNITVEDEELLIYRIFASMLRVKEGGCPLGE